MKQKQKPKGTLCPHEHRNRKKDVYKLRFCPHCKVFHPKLHLSSPSPLPSPFFSPIFTAFFTFLYLLVHIFLKAEAERLAKEKAETERLAKEKAETEV